MRTKPERLQVDEQVELEALQGNLRPLKLLVHTDIQNLLCLFRFHALVFALLPSCMACTFRNFKTPKASKPKVTSMQH